MYILRNLAKAPDWGGLEYLGSLLAIEAQDLPDLRVVWGKLLIEDPRLSDNIGLGESIRNLCRGKSPGSTVNEMNVKSSLSFKGDYRGSTLLWEGLRMLGWHISVYRQQDGGASPATFPTPEGTRIAVWQTGIGGLDWLSELIEAGKAIDLGGNGYPYRFTAIAENLMPEIAVSPPGARDNWLCEAGDIVTDKWEGKTVVDGDAATLCRPDEWLLVEAWDES